MAATAPDAAGQLANAFASIARALVEEASRTVAQAPERLGDAFRDALEQAAQSADDVAALPGALLDQLKDIAEHPDWLGMLTFALVRLVELSGEPSLSVVAYEPGEGWAPAVGVRWRPDEDTELLVAFAVAGEGSNGVVVRTAGQRPLATNAGPALIEAQATGEGTWRFALGAAVAAPEQAAWIELSATLLHDLLPAGAGPLRVSIGRPRVTFQAWSEPLRWQADASFEGDGDGAGLQATVDLAPLLGALGTVVTMSPIDERYSPAVHLRSDGAPKLDLNHKGV